MPQTKSLFQHTSRAAGLLSCLLILGLSACASLPGGLIPPEVTLVDIHIDDLTLFETSGTFTVRITNENPDPVFVTGGSYQLYLGGVKVGKGLSDGQVEVPRLGSATDEAQFFVNNLVAATRVFSLLEEEALDYRLKAKIYVDGPFGTRRLTTVYEGVFEFGEEEGVDIE